MNTSLPLPHSKYSALSLSPVIIDDALEMMNHLNDEQTVKYLIGPPYPVSMEQVTSYILSRPSVNGHRLTWAIRDSEIFIGEVGLEPKTAPRTYELGYSLSRSYWNNGIATMAVDTYLNMMVQRISDGEDITIEAGYLEDNFKSGRVLKKCGFIETGYEEKIKNGQTLQGIRMVRVIPGKKQTPDPDYP